MSNPNTFSRPIRLLALFLAASCILSSCQKTTGLGTYVNVAICNFAAGVPSVDVYVNQTIKEPGFPYGNLSGVSNNPYFFLTKTDGAGWSIDVRPSGTYTSLYSGAQSWADFKNYSILIYDTLPALKVLNLSDDLATPVVGKARVRFVHVVHPFSATGLSLLLDTTALYRDIPYGTASEWQTVNAGSYLMNIAKPGGSGLIQNAIGGVPIALREQKIYTIISRGLPGMPINTPLALTISVLGHN
jgi:hypothetical protein